MKDILQILSWGVVIALAAGAVAVALVISRWVSKKLPLQEQAAADAKFKADQVYHETCETARARSWPSDLARQKRDNGTLHKPTVVPR